MSKNVKGMISFLDVLIMRKNYTIETTVYRKQTHNDIFYTEKSFTPEAWKRGVFRTSLFRVYIICANKELLEKRSVIFHCLKLETLNKTIFIFSIY